MKTYSKSNHRWCSIKTVFSNISQNSWENTCTKASLLIKFPEVCNFIKKETLAQIPPCEFCEIFKNISFTEHLWVSASDNLMQVVVIYNLNLSLQFVKINYTFSLL